MAKTHWRETPAGYEFLGAYADDHKPSQRSGQIYGLVITIAGTPQEVLDRLADRTLLVNLPVALRKQLKANNGSLVPWAQLEGFVK
jgi:hypothetical protein